MYNCKKALYSEDYPWRSKVYINSNIVKFLAVIALVLSASIAMAQEGLVPNGNYSSIGLSLSRTTYANVKCPYIECHEGYGALGLNVSYQLIPNMIIGLQNSAGQSNGSNTTIKESQGGLYVGFVVGVGSSFDIGGLVSRVTKKYETCLGNLCSASEDRGNDVGVFGKWWLNDSKTFNLGLNLDSYAYSTDATRYSSSALSVSYTLANHHEFSLSGARLKNTSGTDVNTSSSMSYNYHF